MTRAGVKEVWSGNVKIGIRGSLDISLKEFCCEEERRFMVGEEWWEYLGEKASVYFQEWPNREREKGVPAWMSSVSHRGQGIVHKCV